MKTKISAPQMLVIGLTLFAMFLGAGNIIFAPLVGQQAGKSSLVPMSAFLLTGVGLVLLAIIVLAKAGGRVEPLSDRVHPWFSRGFCALLFLALGPLYVIPRTGSVVYEIALKPHLDLSDDGARWMLLAFSAAFTALTIFLSLDMGKLVARLGKLITPVFSVLLLIIIGKSFLTPMGAPQDPIEPYLSGTFLKGFTEGYFTMDALAALVFGGVFIQSIKAIGITEPRAITKVFIKAGVITVIGLSVLHISMAWIGATSVDAIGRFDNGGAVLAESSRYLLGTGGVIAMGVVVLLTGITTNIACLSSVSEYFSNITPRASYRRWVYIFGLAGLLFTNFGLETVLETAIPLLMFLYPLSITLILLVMLNRFFSGYQSVYIGAILGAGLIGLFDGIKSAGLFVDGIDNALAFIPMFAQGGGWIIPAFAGGLLGYLVARLRAEPKREYPEAQRNTASEPQQAVSKS
ncbi:branched-chain amino acid transport system II carrier protein [Glutamicibacter ardleyensis]|uniref:branched-chain amino acid transport system II carrier protein n=1 Tax=Glutamicibacter ardleyensis TaxID=225894 RepID=UPI003FB71763